MRETRDLMGMPVTVEIVDAAAAQEDLDAAFAFFDAVDRRFSTYKDESEISRINRGELRAEEASEEMRDVLDRCARTKAETNGYFDIVTPDGTCDPSGLVKGWAIRGAADLLRRRGLRDFYVDAGGDIQVSGRNGEGKRWSIGIRNPFDRAEIVKAVYVADEGVATSGTYIRGQHVYDPHHKGDPLTEIVSLTVIGPDIYEADRFATAAFAMGGAGVAFIEQLPGFEGYQIDRSGIATMTSRFETYTRADA